MRNLPPHHSILIAAATTINSPTPTPIDSFRPPFCCNPAAGAVLVAAELELVLSAKGTTVKEVTVVCAPSERVLVKTCVEVEELRACVEEDSVL